jgi:hypothetical protein
VPAARFEAAVRGPVSPVGAIDFVDRVMTWLAGAAIRRRHAGDFELRHAGRDRHVLRRAVAREATDCQAGEC